MLQKSVFVFLAGFFGISALAAPQYEYLCTAQCVFVNTRSGWIDLGYSVEGSSDSSMSEAFYDLTQRCGPNGVLVLEASTVQNRIRDEWDRISHVEFSSRGRHRVIRIHTEDHFEFDLSFATAKNSCLRSEIYGQGGRRYSGGHPIGG